VVVLPADDTEETAPQIRAERSETVVNLDVVGTMEAAE
jgi:hypothetical protein